MEAHENKELTKKVLNALDPKYISSQDQKDKITNVFRKFRDHTKVLQTTAQKAAITGEKHLEKKGFFQKGVFDKEWRSKQAIFNPKATSGKNMYERLRARKYMPHTSTIKRSNYKNTVEMSGGNKTRKRSNILANSMRK